MVLSMSFWETYNNFFHGRRSYSWDMRYTLRIGVYFHEILTDVVALLILKKMFSLVSTSCLLRFLYYQVGSESKSRISRTGTGKNILMMICHWICKYSCLFFPFFFWVWGFQNSILPPLVFYVWLIAVMLYNSFYDVQMLHLSSPPSVTVLSLYLY